MVDPHAITDVLDGIDHHDATPRVLFLSAASGLAQDRSWVWDLQSRYDLVHWHGGVRGLGEECARRMTGALAEVGKALVVTVDPPAVPGAAGPVVVDPEPVSGDDVVVEDPGALDVLVRAAAAVIVCDEVGAARARDRWQVEAVVVADPDEDDESCDAVYRSVVAGLS